VRVVPTDVGSVQLRIWSIRNADDYWENFVSELIWPFRWRSAQMDDVLAYAHMMAASRGDGERGGLDVRRGVTREPVCISARPA